MEEAKFKIGDHLQSRSGKTYIVLDVCSLDFCGSIGYTVRRLRAGCPWGPRRRIAEGDMNRCDTGDM